MTDIMAESDRSMSFIIVFINLNLLIGMIRNNYTSHMKTMSESLQFACKGCAGSVLLFYSLYSHILKIIVLN